MHDHLQQLLVSAKYRVASLSQMEDPTVKVAAQEIEELLSEVIEASRSLTSELSPAIIREGGLRTGMEWLVSFMAAQNALSVRLSMSEDFDGIEDNTKVLLFDSTRELLTNAVKHGKVHSADVSVRRIGVNLEIVVEDRGAGFAPASLKKQNGFGLFRIHNRLELIGGRMEVDSAPGKGSRFAIIVPSKAPRMPLSRGRNPKPQFPGRESPSAA